MKKQHVVNPYILDPRHKLTISVFGVGGTGSFLLSKLARLNVALQKVYDYPGLHVKAYDPDIIEDHNFMRSTFSPADSGLPKASTIVSRINRYYGTKWEGFDSDITLGKNKDLFQSTNILFLCVDTLAARKKITKRFDSFKGYHHTDHFYTIDSGNDVNTGQVILSQAKNEKDSSMTKYMWELFDSVVDNNVKSCSARESLSSQNIFINEFMAIIAAEMLKDLILNVKMNYNAVFANLEDFNINKTFL